MPAVYHNPWDVDLRIVVHLAKQALFLIKQLVGELVYLVSIKIRRVLGLLKEESCRVLQFFHLNQNNNEHLAQSYDLFDFKQKEWIERSFAF